MIDLIDQIYTPILEVTSVLWLIVLKQIFAESIA